MSLSGSGALSHVYIQHPPLRCNIPETQGLYYDDGNKIILSPTCEQVLSWKVGSFAQCDPPGSDFIGEGPILFIRCSLDRKVIAIQRSNHDIQLKNRETGEVLIQRCKPESESILGFFWTDCPTCDLVLVKTSGLDLLSYEPEFKRIQLVETKKLNVSWYVYTHESRMLLLASGMQCKFFSGYQFSHVGIVRLPKFEMKMAISEVIARPVLSAEDVKIVTIYGRIYCLQTDRINMQLHMYRFYRDAVVHQGCFPIYSTRIAVSVVDNVLLVHQIDAKVVILYDVFLDSLSPISAPLPILVKGVQKEVSSSDQTNIQQDVGPNQLNGYQGIIFGDSWSFLVPDLICDVDHGLIWKIHLDLNAIAASSSEVPSILEFLQRRRFEPLKIKQLCLTLLRTIILERRPISVIARAINVIVTSFAHEVKLQNASHRGAARISSDNPVSRDENVSGSGEQIQRDSVSGTLNQIGRSHRQTVSADIYSSSNTNNQPTDTDSNSEKFDNLGQGKALPSETKYPVQCFQGDSHPSSMSNVGVNNTRDEMVSCCGNVSQIHNTLVTSVAISPEEMHNFVFTLVEEAMVGDPAYLVAVIVEFLRCATLEKLKVPSSLYTMTIRLLACSDRYAELGMFTINKVLEPSREVALQLIETGHKQTRKLGTDMLKQLMLHEEYVHALSQNGHHIEALRYAKKNKVAISQPSLYLEAAFSSNNVEHLATMLRFFSENVPGFSTTSDHTKYYHIISGIS